jgi:hypothetical protein
MATPTDNPIAERVDQLHDQWTLFAKNRDARVLRWVVEADEVAVLDAWMAKESHPDAAETPDLFLVLDTPFTLPPQHGVALREAMRTDYEANKAALEQAGVKAQWQCPPYRQGTNDIAAFFEALESLRATHGEGIQIVAVCFRPEHVVDPQAYALWLQRLAQTAPPHFRFIVPELRGTNAFAPLAQAEPKRVVTQTADLDMPSALEQISAEAGNLDTPGGQFRHIYVQMGGAAKKGDLATADALGASALAIAEQQGWSHLGGVIHFFMGSLLLQLGRNVDAYHRFVATDAAGQKSEAAGEASGKKMRLQGRIAAGTALFQEKAYPQAARVYLETAPIANAAEDKRAEIDCLRLASYCFELAGDVRQAWAAGAQGLQMAATMDEETRRTSTLPYLGEGMLRLTRDPHLGDAASIDRRMQELLGPNWRPVARPDENVPPARRPGATPPADARARGAQG